MVYIVNLHVDELSRIDGDLSISQRLTKALPVGVVPIGSGPRLTLILSWIVTESLDATGKVQRSKLHTLAWMGVVLRSNTVGSVEKSITIDPLRKCVSDVVIDGPQGLLDALPESARRAFVEALASGDVGYCDLETWEEFSRAVRSRHPSLVPLLDWLTAQANPPVLSSNSIEDRAWQEQWDAAHTVLRLTDFPLSAFAAWRRPTSSDAPYLAGLIPEPVEHSMIDHDARGSVDDAGLFDELRQRSGLRCDIHVMHDGFGRRLEVANVNATPVEGRLGTDLIYYHEFTHSFVLVQYKRLDPATRSITVDKRLFSQMDRLDAVAALSSTSSGPHDWRLGSDACFLKLAYWPENQQRSASLAPGMYLPLSYVRMLLKDESTRGRGNSRILGYQNIERYLVSTQFIELVKHGLAGTVGTTVEQLREFGTRRAEDGYSVLLAAERGPETPRERQSRTNGRGPKRKIKIHQSYQQPSLFELG